MTPCVYKQASTHKNKEKQKTKQKYKQTKKPNKTRVRRTGIDL